MTKVHINSKQWVPITMSVSSMEVQHPFEGLHHRQYTPVSPSAKALHVCLATRQEIDEVVKRLAEVTDPFYIKILSKSALVDIYALIELLDKLSKKILTSEWWTSVHPDDQVKFLKAKDVWAAQKVQDLAALKQLRNKLGAHRDFERVSDSTGQEMTWEALCTLWSSVEVEPYLSLYKAACNFLKVCRRTPVHTYFSLHGPVVRIVYANEQGVYRIPRPGPNESGWFERGGAAPYSESLDELTDDVIFSISLEAPLGFCARVDAVGGHNPVGYLNRVEKALKKLGVLGKVIFDTLPKEVFGPRKLLTGEFNGTAFPQYPKLPD